MRTQFDNIPSFLGAPVGDIEDLVPDQVALAGYFCDNLNIPAAGQRYLARQLRYASSNGDTQVDVIDLGDVNVFPLEPDKHLSMVVSQCTAVIETGARMVLIGGDSSGLNALNAAANHIFDTDVHLASVTAGYTGNLSKSDPVILSVDLQALAAIWLSQPSRLTGISPAQLIARIDSVPGNVIAAAIFGLAPALDARGSRETQAALAILQAITDRLAKGDG